MKKLLMATDLSGRSDRALQRAIALADEHGAELKIVHVVDDTLPQAIIERQEETAKSAIEAQIASLSMPQSLNYSMQVIRGQDYSDILRCAEELGAELIILGIHRHATREMFRGTTAERVIRVGSWPTLVVKEPVTGPYKRVIVPSDLSVHSRHALLLACELAPKGEIYLVHATHAPFKGLLGRDTLRGIVRHEQHQFDAMLKRDIEHLTGQLGAAAPRFETVLEEGDVRQVIRAAVERIKPDLLAVGTHGRTGIGYAMLGNVAEDLLADAPVDVLAVKAS